MPSLGFVLPHWLYWAALLLFPLVAMAMVKREEARRRHPAVSLPIAYLFLVCGGFAGLHRFYLKSAWGFLYVPLLVAIIYGNAQERNLRETISAARANTLSYERVIHREEAAVKRGRSGAQERLDAAKAQFADADAKLKAVQEQSAWWHGATGIVALVMLAALAVDVVLLPSAVRRTRIREESEAQVHPHDVPFELPPEDVAARPPTHSIARAIDGMNHWVGQFIAYWTVIAVFAYFYEVVARFLFNSPTNWAHESMFLMFGMQYLLCGAYALRTESHVRVDVLYVKMGPRGRAVADVLTSFFFFVFTLTLLVTGWRFAQDAVNMGETSFTEWGIQYWVVKLTIPVGAVLLLLQGVAHLLRDIDLAFGPSSRLPAPRPAATHETHGSLGGA
ncbi:TRAP transporter small permease subunit [Azospirillum sp.]|uniref:TRAP transporter small permease subunit n=1 Tax=Azospirillum sp. TaxID=34012 RepID=UPI003D760523